MRRGWIFRVDWEVRRPSAISVLYVGVLKKKNYWWALKRRRVLSYWALKHQAERSCHLASKMVWQFYTQFTPSVCLLLSLFFLINAVCFTVSSPHNTIYPDTCLICQIKSVAFEKCLIDVSQWNLNAFGEQRLSLECWHLCYSDTGDP